MTEHVKVEISDGVMTLTLQRPEKKNALTGAMYNAMSAALSLTKRLMRGHQRIAAQIAAEGDVFKERLTTPEAFAAFAERRPPDFSKLSARLARSFTDELRE